MPVNSNGDCVIGYGSYQYDANSKTIIDAYSRLELNSKGDILVRNNMANTTNSWTLEADGTMTLPAGNTVTRDGITLARSGQSTSVNCICAGYVTNSTKRIVFFIPLPFACNQSGLTTNVDYGSTGLTIRTPSGYINSSQYFTATVTKTVMGRINGVTVQLDSDTAFTNVSNNQPITAYFAGTVSFT